MSGKERALSLLGRAEAPRTGGVLTADDFDDRATPSSRPRVLAWPAPSAGDLNPYVTLMYSAFADRGLSYVPFEPLRYHGGADLFHIQWPEAIFWGRGGQVTELAALKARHVLGTARVIRRRGGSVVLTVHNLEPHAHLSARQKALWTRYYSKLLAEVDLIVSLSSAGHTLFTSTHPVAAAIESAIIPHPSYEGVYPRTHSSHEAKALLGLPQNTLTVGAVGSVRPSKNVPDVVSSFVQLEDKEVILLVAGAGDQQEWKRIKDLASGNSRCRLIESFLDDAELSRILAATDLLVIGQKQTLNSGTVLLGLTANCRVLAPSVPPIEELRKQVGSDWIMTYHGEISPESLGSAFNWARLEKRQQLVGLVSPVAASNMLVDALLTLHGRRRGAAGSGPPSSQVIGELAASIADDHVAAAVRV